LKIKSATVYIMISLMWKSATIRYCIDKVMKLLYKIPPLKTKLDTLAIVTTYGLYLIYTTKLIEKLMEVLKQW